MHRLNSYIKIGSCNKQNQWRRDEKKIVALTLTRLWCQYGTPTTTVSWYVRDHSNIIRTSRYVMTRKKCCLEVLFEHLVSTFNCKPQFVPILIHARIGHIESCRSNPVAPPCHQERERSAVDNSSLLRNRQTERPSLNWP